MRVRVVCLCACARIRVSAFVCARASVLGRAHGYQSIRVNALGSVCACVCLCVLVYARPNARQCVSASVSLWSDLRVYSNRACARMQRSRIDARTCTRSCALDRMQVISNASKCVDDRARVRS